MGVLSDREIMDRGIVDPCVPGVKRAGKISYGLTSYGYDARIGYKFKVFNGVNSDTDYYVIDPKKFDPALLTDVDLTGPDSPDHVIIPPNSFVLGETVETFTIPRDVLAIVVGKSTIARCGIIVNVTPLEPEWTGKVTVEISNTTQLPAKIYAGEGIMQVIFLVASSECVFSYLDKGGKYQNQTGLTLPTVDR